MTAPFDLIISFLDRIEHLDADAKRAAFRAEIVSTGGNYLIPHLERIEDRHLHEINLHGLTEWSFGEDATIQRWERAARNVTGHETGQSSPGTEASGPTATYDADQQARQMLSGLIT